MVVAFLGCLKADPTWLSSGSPWFWVLLDRGSKVTDQVKRANLLRHYVPWRAVGVACRRLDAVSRRSGGCLAGPLRGCEWPSSSVVFILIGPPGDWQSAFHHLIHRHSTARASSSLDSQPTGSIRLGVTFGRPARSPWPVQHTCRRRHGCRIFVLQRPQCHSQEQEPRFRRRQIRPPKKRLQPLCC